MEIPLSHAKMRQKSAPQKVSFLMAISIQKIYIKIVTTNALARFHRVTHYYTTSFSRKTVLYETNNIFNSLGNEKLDKSNS